MKTKSLSFIMLLAGLFFLNSCDGPSPKNYEEFPPGEDFRKVYNAMSGVMKENAQLYEVKGYFKISSRNMTPPTDMEVTYISEKNDEIFYEYNYNMVDGIWTGPRQVTLHEGSTKGRVMNREEFSDILFTLEDMPDFSLFDSMYEKALEAAEMGDDGYVIRYNMNKFDGDNNFFITVSTKDEKTKKEVYFDKAGNVLGIID